MQRSGQVHFTSAERIPGIQRTRSWPAEPFQIHCQRKDSPLRQKRKANSLVFQPVVDQLYGPRHPIYRNFFKNFVILRLIYEVPDEVKAHFQLLWMRERAIYKESSISWFIAFPHHLIKAMLVGENIGNIKCVFDFLYSFCLKRFIILRRIQRYIFINV